MKTLALSLLLIFVPQKSESVKPELRALRAEFVKATEDYKTSLRKLLTIYEGNVTKAEDKLELSRKLVADNLISSTQVEEIERALAAERERVEATKREIAKADQQIADVLDDKKYEQEYKRAVQQRRRVSRSRCSNWTLTASQRTTRNSVSLSYKFVCQN